MKDLHDLLVHELKDLYSAEKQLTKALPKMAKAATHPELKQAILNHLEETKTHVNRLEEAFEMLGQSTRGSKCEAMQGLVEEGSKVLKEDAEPAVLDAAIICSAQRVEHYEIAAYGCARTFAEQLGENRLAKLLQQTLDEESSANELLTEIAENSVNVEAMQVGAAE